LNVARIAAPPPRLEALRANAFDLWPEPALVI